MFLIAGRLLGYEPHTTGYTLVSTYYKFNIKNAMGIWLIGLAVSLLFFLICILIRKIYLTSANNNEAASDK
ncbi:MAG: hypothetical protein E7616_05085 [Ruminococcaceae bacterium]|nr:hypothetical protein [Oscillospiraceae bacterium]